MILERILIAFFGTVWVVANFNALSEVVRQTRIINGTISFTLYTHKIGSIERARNVRRILLLGILVSDIVIPTYAILWSKP